MAVVLAFVSVTVVSAVSLAGLLTLSMREDTLRRISAVFISFASGALLGDAFLHLVPASFGERAPLHPVAASIVILSGILLFFVLEKLLLHRHLTAHHGESHARRRTELATMNVVGDAIHNYVDGLLIGASWLVSPALGVSTTVAVVLHEVPQEFADFSILIHSGRTVRQATLLNAASAAVAILGTATALGAGTVAYQSVTGVLVPFTAGGFVYIALADLVPELQHERSLRSMVVQTLLMAAGIAVMALLTMLE